MRCTQRHAIAYRIDRFERAVLHDLAATLAHQPRQLIDITIRTQHRIAVETQRTGDTRLERRFHRFVVAPVDGLDGNPELAQRGHFLLLFREGTRVAEDVVDAGLGELALDAVVAYPLRQPRARIVEQDGL